MVLSQPAPPFGDNRRQVCAACHETLVSSRRDAKFCCGACRQWSYRARQRARRETHQNAVDLAARLIG